MEAFLGIPAEGWKALAIWGVVLVIPWTYSLYFLRAIDRSGVARWGAKGAEEDGSGAGGSSA